MKIIPRRRKVLFLLIFFGFLSVFVYISPSFFISRVQLKSHSKVICRLPRLDPFNASIAHLITNYIQDSNSVCQGTPKIFELVNGRIKPRDDSLLDNVLKKSVKFETLERPEGDDDGVTYGNEVFFLKSNRKIHRIQSDFVKVSYRLDDRSRKVEMFAQVARKKKLVKQPKESQLNVVLIGFDSTSNANFRRKLPESYSYLVNNLKAFVFNGYSIVGDGTTPALTAMLTGKSLKSLADNLVNLDHWPWIMQDYKEHGYVTLYAEDDPRLASFNNRLRGFNMPPADHYMRPFWLSVEQQGMNGHKRNKTGVLYRVCFNSEPLHNITLNYVTSFMVAYSDMPRFAFAYISYLSHGSGEKLSFADKDLLLFLRNYEEYHKDSILIIFGDHGARIGPIRNTIQGSIEERLPWLSIVTPPWFEQRYPNFVNNMLKNQHLVTSPFDIHHTLHHVLGLEKNAVGTSLFSPLSSERSCADAGVDDHWCPCLNWRRTDASSPLVQTAALMLVKEINKMITRKSIFIHLCATIYLVDIVLATKLNHDELNSKPKSRHTSTYPDNDKIFTYLQVTVKTNPGDGTFQATFKVDFDSNLTINPHISRTNKYGKNPWCIPRKYHYMRKFCTCKQAHPHRRP